MGIFSVDGYPINADVPDILSEYEWVKPKWKPDKLIAASPFRDDSTPSFFVNLEHGGWSDSGAYDQEYESGNLAKLLAFLRNETYEESVEYLVALYGVGERKEGEHIELPEINIAPPASRITLAESVIEPYMYRNPYLGKRGITEKVQQFMGVGYSRNDRAVTMPWRHADGSLANVKYRQIYGKTFWYAKGGAPIRELVYGIDKVYKHGLKEVIVCEAEIDALSWMVCGYPAIALGGTAVTNKQLDIIRRSPIERLIKASDNDQPGEKMGRKLTAGLHGYLAVDEAKVPAQYKDANEALVAGFDLSSVVP